jgi:hypothetical protein
MEITRFATIVAAALAIARPCAAQPPKLLQITSPAGSAIVNPGQIVKVTVTSPANVRFEAVAVMSRGGISGDATSVPAELSVRIPPDSDCGKYLVSVVGRTVSGQSVSAYLELDVERPDTPTELSFLNDWRQLELRVGEDLHLNVLATFSDGSILEVTESSRVTFRSSNTRVATVDRNGAITAIGAGRATVTAAYTQGNRSVRTAVQVEVPASPDVIALNGTGVRR